MPAPNVRRRRATTHPRRGPSERRPRRRPRQASSPHRPRFRRESLKAAGAAFVVALAVAALGLVAAADPPAEGTAGPGATGLVDLQLLAVNDFHGRLETPKSLPREAGGPPVPIGGAAALAAHLDRAERSHPGRTIRAHAGDMVGASPLLSSHFHDEPSVRAMNLMDFDVGTLGNHEFDEGGDELLRLLRGGHRDDGLQFKPDAEGREVDTSDPSFEGVRFPYIAANTVDRDGRLALAPTMVVERAGARVGFIGVTTRSTPHHLLSEHSDRFEWRDISSTVNRYAAELQRQGVEAIVVLAHSGATQEERASGEAAGEIVDEVREMTPTVDAVIAGHTHSRLNLRVPNRGGEGDKLVVEARSFGVAFDRLRMTVDRATGEVVEKSADVPSTFNDEVDPDPGLAALVDRYRRALGGLGDRVVGRAAVPILRRRRGAAGGSIGALAARAQRRLAGADVAFVQEGNARGDLDAGPITYDELFEASAYEHPVMRMEVQGRHVLRLLGRGYLYVSGPDAPIDPDADYVVAANRLLVDKGVDVFRRHGRNMRAVGTDLEALTAEVERAGVIE